MKSILVICVDRDNDLGRKAGVKGPVIGKKKNIAAAVKLALKDPTDSDSNCMFGAVKKFDEIKKSYNNVEIVTLTGKGKSGLDSDIRINEQLDIVMDKFPMDGIIFVSDGAEDDQVLPIIQSRAPIISKEKIYVKQAREVESTYYTIKEALKDPSIGGVVFGIPGLVLMLYAIVVFLGYQTIFFQTLAFVLGSYLIAKWTGIEDKINKTIGSLTKSISLQRTSFPFYIAVIFIIGFGIMSAYSNFILTRPEITSVERGVEAFSQLIMFVAIASISFYLGKAIDAVHLKKAYRLRRCLLSTVFVILIWYIIESGKNVVIGNADLNLFIGNIIISFFVALGVYKISNVFDITKKVTKLLIGVPVYNEDGKWLGRVVNVAKDKNIVEFKDNKTKKLKKLAKKEFVFREGKIQVVTA